MDASAKSEMLPRIVTPAIEAIGLGKHRRIAIGTAQHHHDAAAGWNTNPPQGDISQTGACLAQDRRVPAQTFLDNGVQCARLSPEALPLVGLTQQRVQAVPQ